MLLTRRFLNPESPAQEIPASWLLLVRNFLSPVSPEFRKFRKNFSKMSPDFLLKSPEVS